MSDALKVIKHVERQCGWLKALFKINNTM